MSSLVVTYGSHFHRHLLSRIPGIYLVATPGKPVFISHQHITARFASPRLHALFTQLLEHSTVRPGI